MFAHFTRGRKETSTGMKKKLTNEEKARELMVKHGITLDEAADLVKNGQKSLSSFRFR